MQQNVSLCVTSSPVPCDINARAGCGGAGMCVAGTAPHSEHLNVAGTGGSALAVAAAIMHVRRHAALSAALLSRAKTTVSEAR